MANVADIYYLGQERKSFWQGFLQRHFSIKTEKLTGFALVTFFIQQFILGA